MAKLIGPAMSMGASGKIGAIVYDKRNYARVLVVPNNPQTVAQMTNRHIHADIQFELKTLGAVLRPQVKTALGYRWNSLIISELKANNNAKFTAYQAEWDAFTTGKAAWVSADVALGLTNPAGGCFYAVAKAFYDVCFRISGDGLITEPAEGNAATVGAEWIDNTP